MVSFLFVVGILQVLFGLIMGVRAATEHDFHLLPVLGWWIGGVTSGAVFFALGFILDSVRSTEGYAYQLLRNYNRDNPAPAEAQRPLGNSKSSLSKLSSYRMGTLEKNGESTSE
ncbi:hypothetical protein MJA45_15325 [Paenibacillus aurantius]|uniref:Uncharacterized protein n=1 Tax=Paenibacillus aurantius TaxID=2918900 RepID=A0AA96L941_9BACL|nr:hypothetical protein [Paenibacillus aurantius]WNQ09018.1 hypothetical protein MJA45_15325 [Paenibacillus aurantius]